MTTHRKLPPSRSPVVCAIAGSDSGAGAGVQADLKTCAALGVYAVTVVTALTAQNTCGVRHVEVASDESVAEQLAAVLEDFAVAAVKIGLLPNPGVVREVARVLSRRTGLPVVLDPVGAASAGGDMQVPGTPAVMAQTLFPHVTLLTPNAPEAAALARIEIEDEHDVVRAGERLRGTGVRYVLVKGGHRGGPLATDVLVGPRGARRFSAARLPVRNDHGTGCTLASAVAAYLARGWEMDAAVGEAKRYLTDALAGADALNLGRGRGPLDHFVRSRPPAATRAVEAG